MVFWHLLFNLLHSSKIVNYVVEGGLKVNILKDHPSKFHKTILLKNFSPPNSGSCAMYYYAYK
jgi:hypothetical protein